MKSALECPGPVISSGGRRIYFSSVKVAITYCENKSSAFKFQNDTNAKVHYY